MTSVFDKTAFTTHTPSAHLGNQLLICFVVSFQDSLSSVWTMFVCITLCIIQSTHDAGWYVSFETKGWIWQSSLSAVKISPLIYVLRVSLINTLLLSYTPDIHLIYKLYNTPDIHTSAEGVLQIHVYEAYSRAAPELSFVKLIASSYSVWYFWIKKS